MGRILDALMGNSPSQAKPAGWIERVNIEAMERETGVPVQNGETVQWTLFTMRITRK